MSLPRRDVLALLIALSAAIAGVVVWNHGTVDLGLQLASEDGRVMVVDVTPDGNAAQNYWSPYTEIVDIQTFGDLEVERGEELILEDGRTVRPPIEPIDPASITTIESGSIESDGLAYSFGSLDRGVLEAMLDQSILLAALGIGLGILCWRALTHGLLGGIGRANAILLGAAVATPFLLVPVIQVGTPAGILAGYLVPAALSLLLGLSLARRHSDRSWVQTGMAATVVAAGLVVLFVFRYITAPALGQSGDRTQIFILIAAIAVVPAAIASLDAAHTTRERTGFLALSMVPVTAQAFAGPVLADTWWLFFFLIALVVWRVLPIERITVAAGEALSQVRSGTSTVASPDGGSLMGTVRDRLTYVLLGLSVFIGLNQSSTWTIVLGVALAALVGFAVRRGFMGTSWTDAAVPLAAAVGIPVILFPFNFNFPVATIPAAFAALGVAHLLASRHTDPVWQGRLFLGSAGLVGLIVLLSLGNAALAIPLLGAVALIPGFPTAFAIGPGEPPAVTSRLETLAIALTPGAAATILIPSTNGLLLGAWLAALVVWRQFTLRPLVGMAQRTQLQRDVAVAAAETERARLAADLHDDALQQLTMLVRTLDESGQADAAAEARDVATKLRSVVGDLRLPILDDLGAGAALEWLVERMEPLAGGPVKLERSDATRPPANVELAVFRVAQEALTNAVKHGSTPIAVRYDVNADGRVTLAVDDAGVGIGDKAAEEAPNQGHFGLLNMHQRAEQIGALLDVRRWPAGGTRVALEWRPQ